MSVRVTASLFRMMERMYLLTQGTGIRQRLSLRSLTDLG